MFTLVIPAAAFVVAASVGVVVRVRRAREDRRNREFRFS